VFQSAHWKWKNELSALHCGTHYSVCSPHKHTHTDTHTHTVTKAEEHVGLDTKHTDNSNLQPEELDKCSQCSDPI